MKASEIFENVRVLIDEWTTDGLLIPDSDIADLREKSIKLINMGQKELYRIGDLYKSYVVSIFAPENAIKNPFQRVEHTGGTTYFPDEKGVEGKSYYLEINQPCTVEVEIYDGGWSVAETINHTLETTSSYKGNLADNSGVRFKVSGSFYATMQNLAVYPYNYTTVPDFKKYVEVEMPDDFKMVAQIVSMELPKGYARESMYKWEGKRKLFVNRDFDAEMRITYKPIPVTITSLDDDMEIDDITAEAIAYYVGARLAPFENKELVTFFESKYMEMKMELTYDEVAVEERITDEHWGDI